MSGTIKQITTFNEETGEVLSEVTSKGSANGSGWFIMYGKPVYELLKKCTGSQFKVFAYLAAGQQFEERGMVTTKKAVGDYLGMNKSTVTEAFKFLKENHIISEVKANGVSEWLVNPVYVTVGRDRKKRQKVWQQSWVGEVVETVPDPIRVTSKARASLPTAPSSGRSIEIE